MPEIKITVNNCKQCPHFKTGNHYSSDGFDSMVDWLCEKEGDKKIQGAVEWHEEKSIEIPDWCPIKV